MFCLESEGYFWFQATTMKCMGKSNQTSAWRVESDRFFQFTRYNTVVYGEIKPTIGWSVVVTLHQIEGHELDQQVGDCSGRQHEGSNNFIEYIGFGLVNMQAGPQ